MSIAVCALPRAVHRDGHHPAGSLDPQPACSV